MSLWPAASPVGPMTWLYATCENNPGTGLCGSPPTRLYCNRFTESWGGGTWRGLIHFYYYSLYDCFVIPAIFDYQPYYMGYLVLHPETGQRQYQFEQFLPASGLSMSLWDILATKALETGTFGKVFCVRCFMFSTTIYEIDPGSMAYNGGWYTYDNWLPSYPSNWIIDGSDGAIVNLADGLIAVAGSDFLQAIYVWEGIKHTEWNPTLRGTIQLGCDGIYDTAYENRESMWISMVGGYIAKINYKELRVEFLSQLPNVSEEDRRYLIAWDSKRGRLAVFRQKWDDPVTGACQCTLEFYRPIGKAELLSDPVPVGSLRAGKQIPFIFHLTGTAGEPISPYSIKATLDDPAEGKLLTRTGRTGVGGMGSVEYEASLITGDETIRLEADITDGE